MSEASVPVARGSARDAVWSATLGRVALLLTLVATIVPRVTSAAAAGGARPESTAVHHRGSIRDEPGYVYTPDPESLSVLLGRRLNAPRVSTPFTGGTRSLDEMGRRVCRVFNADAHRSDSLKALCVTDIEFRDILWREFPQSRPATGLTWVDAWRILFARLNGGSIAAVNDWGNQRYEFLGFDRDSIMTYRNFRMHNHLVMRVKDEAGQVERWTWLRSVAERKGQFKIYSMRD